MGNSDIIQCHDHMLRVPLYRDLLLKSLEKINKMDFEILREFIFSS